MAVRAFSCAVWLLAHVILAEEAPLAVYTISATRSQCLGSEEKCVDAAICDKIAQQLGQDSGAAKLVDNGWRHSDYPGGCFLSVDASGNQKNVHWNPNTTSIELPSWSDYRFVCDCEAPTTTTTTEACVPQVLNPPEKARNYSSVYKESKTTFSLSMLDSEGAWLSKEIKTDEYIEIDLGSIMKVVGVITQGRHDFKQWVQSYKVQYYSTDMLMWKNVMGTFTGNTDKRSKRAVSFEPVSAQYIRILARSWRERIALRAGVLACGEARNGYKQIGSIGGGHCGYAGGHLRTSIMTPSESICQALCSAEADCAYVSYRLNDDNHACARYDNTKCDATNITQGDSDSWTTWQKTAVDAYVPVAGVSTTKGKSTTTLSTSTSTSTSSTSTSTSTSVAVSEIVECSLRLDMENARQFVAESDAPTAIRDALAELLKIAKAWIKNLIIKLADGRRLAFLGAVGHESGRILEDLSVTTKMGVTIDFDVVIPPDGGPEQVTATLVMDRFESKSMQEATDTVNKVLQSGVLGSKDYKVEVIVKKSKVVSATPETPTATPPKDATGALVAIILAATGCLFSGLAVYATWCCRKKCLRPSKVDDTSLVALVDAMIRPSPASFSEKYLLNPPADVSADCQSNLVNYVSGMLDASSPAIFVCFSAGNQEDGPGLFFAAAVVRALHEHDIPCYCLLPGSKDAELCLRLLSGSESSCKTFVIVDTGDVYRSRRCLEQIRTARANRIETTRLQFETDLPTEEERWNDICVDDVECEMMRNDVADSFQSCVVSPEPPNTVQTVPSFLDTFALDMKRKLKSLDSYAAMGKVKDAARCTMAIDRMQKLCGRKDLPPQNSVDEDTQAKKASVFGLGSSMNMKSTGTSQKSGRDLGKEAFKLKNIHKFREVTKKGVKEGKVKSKRRSLFSMGAETSLKSGSTSGDLSMHATVSLKSVSTKEKIGTKGVPALVKSRTEGDMSKSLGRAKHIGLTSQAKAGTSSGSETQTLGKALSIGSKKKEKKPSLDSQASTVASSTSVKSTPLRRKMLRASSTPSSAVSSEVGKADEKDEEDLEPNVL